jgi:hypothetical protein
LAKKPDALHQASCFSALKWLSGHQNAGGQREHELVYHMRQPEEQ